MSQTTPFDATMSVASPIRISVSKPSSMLIPEPCTPKPDPLIIANITSPIPHSVPPRETNTTPWKSESITRSSTPQPFSYQHLRPNSLAGTEKSTRLTRLPPRRPISKRGGVWLARLRGTTTLQTRPLKNIQGAILYI